MFKVNTRNTRTRCEICLKLTVKTPERRHWRIWTYFTLCSSVSVVNFEQVNADWGVNIKDFIKYQPHQSSVLSANLEHGFAPRYLSYCSRFAIVIPWKIQSGWEDFNIFLVAGKAHSENFCTKFFFSFINWQRLSGKY